MSTLTNLRILFVLCATSLATSVTSQGPTWASPHAVPPAQRNVSLGYDEGRGRILLFSGGETWEHDGMSWIHRTPAVSPAARGFATFAYDATRGTTMMVGGLNPSNEAWLWDGESWSQLPSAPNGGPWSLLCWHGGTNPGFYTARTVPGPSLNQTTTTTHRWDGTAWTLVSTTIGLGGPSGGTGVYVPGTGRTYVMGGSGVWAWDGANWQPISQTGAFVAQPNLAMVWDEARGRFVMVTNAQNANSATNIGQLVNPGQIDWTVVPNIDPVTNVQSPPPRFSERIAYDMRRQRCVMYGGVIEGTSIPLDDTWVLESSPTLRWQLQPPLAASPTDRVYTDMAFEASSGRMVLFGGNDIGGARNDTWTFDGTAWTDHGPSASVSPRAQPALCYAPGIGTVLFGGGVHPTAYFNDTWFLNGNQWLVSFLTGAPAPRQSHDMVWASGWNCIVMFGGYNGGTLGDTWSLAPGPFGLRWTQMFTQGAMPPRQSHAMAFDERRNRLVVFGGADSNGQFLGDTWELVPATLGWQWVQRTPAQSPPRRWAHKMAYDPARGVAVLTGGYGNPQCGQFCASHLNDVWEYDGDTWTQRVPTTTLPAPREGAGFAYDSQQQRCVLQGGSGNGVFTNETWYYSASNDRFGQGMQGGGALALRCTRFPVAGQPTGFAFDSPLGFGWLSVFLGPAPQVGLTLGPGIMCGTGNFYGVNPIVASAMGSPGSMSFPLPAGLGGLGLVIQGIALDTGPCLRLTDPLAVTIHAP